MTGAFEKNAVLCADLDISWTFYRNIFGEIPINLLLIGLGLLNVSSLQFWTFNAISNQKNLVNWAPVSHV